jgi:hypothetical protein
LTGKRRGRPGRNVNRIFGNRLWDATGREWGLAEAYASLDRVGKLLADPAVPVGVHRYHRPLEWLPPHARQRVFTEAIQPCLVQEMERREAGRSRQGTARGELFQATEWRDRHGASLLLFELLH